MTWWPVKWPVLWSDSFSASKVARFQVWAMELCWCAATKTCNRSGSNRHHTGADEISQAPCVLTTVVLNTANVNVWGLLRAISLKEEHPGKPGYVATDYDQRGACHRLHSEVRWFGQWRAHSRGVLFLLCFSMRSQIQSVFDFAVWIPLDLTIMEKFEIRARRV